jgi:hypothetical protein
MKLSSLTFSFIENLFRITSFDYLPSSEDILKCHDSYFKEMRIETMGVYMDLMDASEFTYNKIKNIKKKTSNIDRMDFNLIVFVVPLTDYLKNNNNINFMTARLNHLKNLIALFPFFPVLIVYMNTEEFRTSISSVDINTCPEFSDYKGGNSYRSSFNFIRKKFSNLVLDGVAVTSVECEDLNIFSVLDAIRERCGAVIMKSVLSNENIY